MSDYKWCPTIDRLLYLLSKYRRHQAVVDLPRRRPRKITDEMKAFIEEMLNQDDEITAVKLKDMLTSRWPEIPVSSSTT